MTDDNLLIVPVPALVAVLISKEREKGAPLTEEEVLAIRDGAACIVMTHEQYAAVAAERGYDDLDPENVWDEWQVTRRDIAVAWKLGVGDFQG